MDLVLTKKEKKKLKKDPHISHCNTEDNTNNKSDDGEGLDKVD